MTYRVSMAKSLAAPKTDTKHLDTESWIAAALDMLQAHGIDGVRVELLARNLGVTKGSFYWHFKDRDALHFAMLENWRRRATSSLIERLNREFPPRERLLALFRLPFSGPRSEQAAAVELAVRLWGRRDPRALAALKEVDSLRTEYIAQLLRQCGVPEDEARARAILGYAYMRVGISLIEGEPEATVSMCEQILLNPTR
jgi:AcrR family transcriptional regulator